MKIKNLTQNLNLINQFIKREIFIRYKGSFLGIMWSFITPILMLAIYTFVFSVVFKARWGINQDTSKIEFALLLFAGLLIFNVFSEVVTRSPTLVTSNANLVKKVVFPLEILPIVALGSSLFHAIISLIILLLAVYIFLGQVYWTIVLFPLVILPICLISLGFGWLISSLGVYIRDINQIVNVGVPALMFLSPIFYPISSIPTNLQFLFFLNPISYTVEDMRRIFIWGLLPRWEWLIFGNIIGILIAAIGFLWFKKTRSGFADVL
ncbi:MULTISPECIES: ABC transporter permease [Bacillaceae]|uniref:ABC transporter permease n=1 Tax=Bacillaceae TaxID=186817 RepID=UPI0029640E85|nr:ABC transporter permease [Bacillus infantis]MDW2876417.1 ABC transporter permease [Bacillus infantis]